MKVLAINSSARKDGNTAILINRIFEELNKEGIETEMIQLSGTVIEPCKACWACGGEENCVHRKDGFPGLYGKYVRQYAGISGAGVCGDRYEPGRRAVPA